jgi:hypothetical protein
MAVPLTVHPVRSTLTRPTGHGSTARVTVESTAVAVTGTGGSLKLVTLSYAFNKIQLLRCEQGVQKG